MSTGRLGTTNIQVLRWSKSPTAGTTVLSGTDDGGQGLAYTVGYEQVFLNGVLLVRGTDYTATNGTSITLTAATVTGDIVNVIAQQVTTVNGDISKQIVTAKGDIITASSSGTPTNLAVGTDGQVLTAASGQATGLQWATPSSGGMTLLSTTTLSGASTTISSINQSYTNLYLSISAVNISASAYLRISPNGSLTTITGGIAFDTIFLTQTASYIFPWGVTAVAVAAANANNSMGLLIGQYANTSYFKPFSSFSEIYNSNPSPSTAMSYGGINSTTAISSLVFSPSTGTFNGGVVQIYGVK